MISSIQRSKVEALQAQLGSPFPYPWEGLEEAIPTMPGGHIPMVGYGSLLNPESAARTIVSESTQRHPCLAFGCRRIYNYRMSDRALVERYDSSPDSPYRAALNVRLTDTLDDYINGILITLDASDVAALTKREYGYDLCPVAALDWDNRENGDPYIAYVLVAPDEASIKKYQKADPTILPQPGYVEICKSGAASISPEFLKVFNASTYLADGETLATPV